MADPMAEPLKGLNRARVIPAAELIINSKNAVRDARRNCLQEEEAKRICIRAEEDAATASNNWTEFVRQHIVGIGGAEREPYEAFLDAIAAMERRQAVRDAAMDAANAARDAAMDAANAARDERIDAKLAAMDERLQAMERYVKILVKDKLDTVAMLQG